MAGDSGQGPVIFTSINTANSVAANIVYLNVTVSIFLGK